MIIVHKANDSCVVTQPLLNCVSVVQQLATVFSIDLGRNCCLDSALRNS